MKNNLHSTNGRYRGFGPILFITICFQLLFLSVKAQTYVNAPLSGTITSGEYYNNSTLSLIPNTNISPGVGQVVHLYTMPPGCVPLTLTPTSTQNYIVTSIPRMPIFDASQIGGRSTCEVMQSVVYYDGLGRTLQAIQVKASPGMNDIIQPLAYDQLGRSSIKYLPYTTSAGGAGSYRADALTGAQTGFYQSQTSNTGVVPIPSGHISYAETRYENDMLNRPLEEGAPGASWQIGSGHNVTTAYDLNSATDGVLAWSLNTGSGAGATADYYAANTLYKTVATDGDQHQTIIYKDMSGRTVRISRQAGTGSFVNTDYIYDDLGNLCYVVPPLPLTVKGTNSAVTAITTFTENDNIFKNFCYGYHYDGKNRQIEKKIAGKDWEYTIYNTADQAILTQDANQRGKGLWMFVKYDIMGRPVMTGEIAAAVDRTTLQGQCDSYTGTLTENFTNSAANFGYTHVSFPDHTTISGSKVLTVKYYDNYTFLNNASVNPNNAVFAGPNAAIDTLETAPKGAATGSLTNVLGSSNYLLSLTHYNKEGKAVKVISQNYQNGSTDSNKYDIEESQYSFNGDLTWSQRRHYLPANAASQVSATIWNTYDHVNRKIMTRQQFITPLVTGPVIVTDKEDYNELGQLKTKHLHSASTVTVPDAGTFLQHVDYRYTARGWLARINDPNNLTDENSGLPATTDVFAEQLDYDQNTNNLSATAGYSGKVSSVKWQTKVPASLSLTQEWKGYTYIYDALNRMTSASSAAQFTGAHQYDETADYDEVGNLTSLVRKNGINSTLNNLTYSYMNGGIRSNRLAAVSDNGSENYSSSYTFDADGNGNVLTDTKKGIISVIYNELNLPSVVTLSNKTITYVYSATGQKLQRLIQQGTTLQENRSYAGGIEYTGNNVEFIYTSTGRAVPSSSGFAFEYNLTDHLGNVRAVFGDKNNDGALSADEILQITDYYAFGREITYNQGLVPNPNNNYKYGGKEFQTDLGQYDYGARFYDPVIGRWGVTDPLAEKNLSWTPYNYVKNDPINRFDPDGMADYGYGATSCETCSVEHYGGDVSIKFGGKTYENLEAFYEANPGVSYAFVNDKDIPENRLEPNLHNPTVLQAALVAQAVYGHGNANSLGGYNYVVENIPGVVWEDKKSGFRSALFVKFSNDGTTSYIYATAGTEMSNFKGSIKDWFYGNGGNLEGLSPQYAVSASNARLISDYLKNENLIFVGHSLGGGLAALNAIVTGRHAITFNAAGVSGATLKQVANIGFFKQFSSFSDQITAYIMKGDPVNFLQGNFWPITDRAQGKRIYVSPVDTWHVPFAEHGIEEFIKAFQNGH